MSRNGPFGDYLTDPRRMPAATRVGVVEGDSLSIAVREIDLAHHSPHFR